MKVFWRFLTLRKFKGLPHHVETKENKMPNENMEIKLIKLREIQSMIKMGYKIVWKWMLESLTPKISEEMWCGHQWGFKKVLFKQWKFCSNNKKCCSNNIVIILTISLVSRTISQTLFETQIQVKLLKSYEKTNLNLLEKYCEKKCVPNHLSMQWSL